MQFFNAENGVNYYIVIKNSNTIETWSKSPGQSFTNDALNFDFLTEDQAYGNNLGLIDSDPVRYGIHSGDVDQDRQVDISDISAIFNDSKTFTTGASDLNGDGVTDLTDLMIAFNNATNYVSVVRP